MSDKLTGLELELTARLTQAGRVVRFATRTSEVSMAEYPNPIKAAIQSQLAVQQMLAGAIGELFEGKQETNQNEKGNECPN